MNKKELFTNFYNDLYKNILDEYYQEIETNDNHKLIKFIISIILFSIIPTFLFWFILYKQESFFFFIVITIVYNSAMIIFLKTSSKDKNKILIKDIKYQILDDIITLITNDEESIIMPNNRISKTSFEKTDLFNLNNDEYTGSNYIKTHLDNVPIVIGDINLFNYVEATKEEYFYIGTRKFYRTYKTKKKKDIFVGCYIGSNINKKNDCLIQIVPNMNIINKKLNKYYNLCPCELKLENLDFNKRYDIFSNDEIKARMLLTLTMMEEINKLEEILDNKKYIIFKNDGRYSIFLENFTIEEILNNNLTNKRNKNKELDNIYNIYNEISKIFEIISILNNGK